MEKMIGLIPNIVVNAAMGPKNYSLLLTDQRSIFILERASKAMLLGVVGDALLTESKDIDHSNLDPEELARDHKNIVIPHSEIKNLSIKKKMSGYFLTIEYANRMGKSKSIKGNLAAPSELVQRNKMEGVNKVRTSIRYVKDAHKLLEKALPLTVTQGARWDL